MKILTVQQAEAIKNAAVTRLAEYILESGLESMVEGISGGIDSAAIAAIMELTKKHLADRGYHIDNFFYFLNCNSKDFDLERATALASALSFDLKYVDLTNDVYNSTVVKFARKYAKTEHDFNVARGNAACRERMKFLYGAARLFRGIYPDTDDLSEEWMRFWTLKGDEGNVKIIQHFTKREIYDLGEYLGVPEIILSSAPGDGLRVTDANTASDQLGLEYETTDYIVSRFLENGFSGNNDARKNGAFVQLNDDKFIQLMDIVANEVGTSVDKVRKVLTQVLTFAFKVKYGDNVAHLLPDRSEFGLPKMGTPEFSNLYRELAQVK